MSKSVYFVSNNKKPNLKFYLNPEKCIATYTTRKEARAALKEFKANSSQPGLNRYYKIFKVSAVNVR